MSDFKWRHFRGEVILWAVRWYCKYGVSYRELEDMPCERGVDVDHTTIYRWVQHYAPEMEKRRRWYWKRPSMWRSWRVDETYVKDKGKWVYLYRAVDQRGDTIDFYLSPTRNAKAAKRFLGKALAGLRDWEKPQTINTDKAPAYAVAIAELKAEGNCPEETAHRQVKYLNNIVEADHGKLKRLIKPTLGFKSMKTAYATLKGFEVMNALRKGQAALWRYEDGVMGEVRLINRQFGIYAMTAKSDLLEPSSDFATGPAPSPSNRTQVLIYYPLATTEPREVSDACIQENYLYPISRSAGDMCLGIWSIGQRRSAETCF